MLIRIQKLICCEAVLTVLAGCGGSPTTSFPVDPDPLPFVQCTIQMAGKPVEQAIVTFHATDGQSPEVMSAWDQDDSCYRFVTTVGGAKKGGVPVGRYTLCVKPSPGCSTRIPAKYTSPAQSGLEAEVKPGGNFLPTIELTP